MSIGNVRPRRSLMLVPRRITIRIGVLGSIGGIIANLRPMIFNVYLLFSPKEAASQPFLVRVHQAREGR